MATKKTLGGDRVGAGKEMQVSLHNYEMSTHDLSAMWRTTASPGTLIPFMSNLALNGDVWEIDLDCNVLTQPTEGPLFGSFKVQLDVYSCPIRLYQGQLHNNKLGIGNNMSTVKIPQISFYLDTAQTQDNLEINQSSLVAYSGIRGVGTRQGTENTIIRHFNALPILMYYDIFKNYYSNKQEENCFYISSGTTETLPDVEEIKVPLPTVVGTIVFGDVTMTLGQQYYYMVANSASTETPSTEMASFPASGLSMLIDGVLYDLNEVFTTASYDSGTDLLTIDGDSINSQFLGKLSSWVLDWTQNFAEYEPKLTSIPLKNFDDMREEILKNMDTSPFLINQTVNIEPYNRLLNYTGDVTSSKMYSAYTQQGLMVKTYQSDLFNNWLNTDWISGTGGISDISAIQVIDDKIKVDQIVLANKVYDILNRIAVSGGTYDDWQEAVYSHKSFRRAETPMYMGGLSKELVFQEVISNASSASESGQQPLGTLAGRGVLTNKHKGGKIRIKIDEPSYIFGIFSLTPRISYSQGNTFDVNLKTMDDLHKPGLDEIGFQDLITELMVADDTVLNSVSSETVFKTIGKQPAWLNYMTDVDRNYGNFASGENENFMVLDRNYVKTDDQWDFTTYIDPVRYNGIFSYQKLDAMNFWVQVKKDIKVRRKMSAKLLPNL